MILNQKFKNSTENISGFDGYENEKKYSDLKFADPVNYEFLLN